MTTLAAKFAITDWIEMNRLDAYARGYAAHGMSRPYAAHSMSRAYARVYAAHNMSEPTISD